MKTIPQIKDRIAFELIVSKNFTIYKKVEDKQATIKNIHDQYLKAIDNIINREPWILREDLLVKDYKNSNSFKLNYFDKRNLPTGLHESLSLFKKLHKNYIRAKTKDNSSTYSLAFYGYIEKMTGRYMGIKIRDVVKVSEKLLTSKLPSSYKIGLTSIHQEILQALYEEETEKITWHYHTNDVRKTMKWFTYLGKGLIMLKNMESIVEKPN